MNDGQVSDGLLTLVVGIFAGSFSTLIWVAIAKCFGWL